MPPPTIQNLIDSTDHLVCFSLRILSPTGFAPPATPFDGTQFGSGLVDLHAASQLCVPSPKSVPAAGGA